MKGTPLGTATAESEEIAQLRERVRALEIRLDRIEQGVHFPFQRWNKTLRPPPLR